MANEHTNNQTFPQQKIFLNAPLIVRYLIGNDPKLDDFIILGQKAMMTTDKELYEALGSLTKYDNFKITKLAKLMEVADVYPHRELTKTNKDVLTFEKMELIRKEALKQNTDDKKK